MNIKAAFLHNVSDALASVGVIVAGSLILNYGWYWVDTVLTLIIAGYVLWQGFTMLPQTMHLLMEGTPDHLSIAEVVTEMEGLEGVCNVHHVHIWQLDEHRNALEAHVVTDASHLVEIETMKEKIKMLLSNKFQVEHSTLEFEHLVHSDCSQRCH
jgi:cobalt-zinc-cadmium efflux system protein